MRWVGYDGASENEINVMPNQSQFYIAWVDSTETTFGPEHLREDELVFSFELKHDEGQFAELELEIVNPREGLLTPGRPLWLWFAWDDGEEVYPLFFGRLIALPDDLFQENIKIKLVARPLDYADQRIALAETLKVLPYYDPVFIDDSKLDDPDTVLEGYSALWHVDRITHEVTISDIITGEDGVVEFAPDEAFYDGVSMKIAGAALLVCEVEAEVSWTQCDKTGVFEMKTLPGMGKAVETSGPTSGGTKFPPNEPWKPPKEQEEQQTTYSWTYKNVSPGPHKDGDMMEESGSATIPYYGGELVKQDKVQQNADKESGQGEEYSIKESYVYAYQYQPPWPPDPDAPPKPPSGGGNTDPKNAKTEIAVEVEQDRKEAMYVAMKADVQPVLASLTDKEKDLLESLKMDGRDPVLAGAVSRSSSVYFGTARGQQSVEFLLMVARAHLLAGSRVVEIEWECPFDRVVDISCRMNAAIEDPRLPGGTALGKIVSYQMTGDGDKGEFVGKITINCSVGNGAPVPVVGTREDGDRVVVSEGTPVYVDGYVDGYQHYVGRMVNAVTNDVAFSNVEFQAVGIQLPVTEDQILVRHEYHDGSANGEVYEAIQQVTKPLRDFEMPAIGTMIGAPPQSLLDYANISQQANRIIAQVIADNPSWVEIEMKPTIGISASAQYQTDVSQLAIPKQITL